MRALIVAACLGFWLARSALGMTIEVHDGRVFATGDIGESADIQAFRDALARPEIKDVVLFNSRGGDVLTAMTVC